MLDMRGLSPVLKNKQGGVNIYTLKSIKDDVAFRERGMGEYMWINLSDYLRFSDENALFEITHANGVKFGQYGSDGKAKLPQETIHSYLGVYKDPKVIVFVVRFTNDLVSTFEKAKYVENMVKPKIGASIKDGACTENYFDSPNNIIRELNEILYGKRTLFTYPSRLEQAEASDKCVDYFLSGGMEFGLFGKMRFGKCHTTYRVIVDPRLDIKRAILVTFKPDVKQGWNEDIDHKMFDGWSCIDAMDFSSNNPIVMNGNEVLLTSAQDLIGNKLSKNLDISKAKKKWKKVFETEIDTLIIDEGSIGMDKDTFLPFMMLLIETLEIKRVIWADGTPILLRLRGRILQETLTEENHFVFDYLEEQKKKLDEAKEGKTEVYKWLPKMVMYGLKYGDAVYENSDKWDCGLSLAELFKSEDGITFVHQKDVVKLLDKWAVQFENHGISPFNVSRPNEVNKFDIQHWFVYMIKSVNACKAMANTMKNHWYFGENVETSEYPMKIIVAAGDNNGESPNTQKLVKDTIKTLNKGKNRTPDGRSYAGTITISCGKLNRGVTIKQWVGAIILSPTVSMMDYFQTIFRVQSSWKLGNKLEAYVFDYDPNRMVMMKYLYAVHMKKSDEDTKTKLNVVVDKDVWPTYLEKGNKLEELDANDIINIEHDENWLEKQLTDYRVWNIQNILKAEHILSKFDKAETPKKEKQVTDNEIPKLPKSGSGNGSGNGNSDEDAKLNRKAKDLLERARSFALKVPDFIFVLQYRETIDSIYDILNTQYKDLFNTQVGITIDEFKFLFDEKVINEWNFNKVLEHLSSDFHKNN